MESLSGSTDSIVRARRSRQINLFLTKPILFDETHLDTVSGPI